MGAGGFDDSAHQHSNEPVKPAEESSVPPAWLSTFEKLSPAENLARLDTDSRLVDELRAAQFSGPKYDYYAQELVKYGLAVLTGWTMRGMIFEKVRKKSFGGLTPPPDDTLENYDAASELAGLVVTVALREFRERVLIPRIWDPAKGASIKTFFVGQCLKQFPNIYRQWYSETYDRVLDGSADLDALTPQQEPTDPDVARRVAIQDEIDGALAGLEPRAQEAFILAAAGHTQATIGDRMGISTKTVERLIAYSRDRRNKGKSA
jgi:hypothetical protein